jgi:phage host-nuclease inhibitor protein Gam
MEDKIQKILKLSCDREASYERQIASLKEEVMAAQRRVQVFCVSYSTQFHSVV